MDKASWEGKAWVAALDGGGTKTAAALADRQGEVVVLPQGAGCNPQDGPGWDSVLREVLGAVLRARGGVAALVLGMPGHGEVPAHDMASLALLRSLLLVPFEVMNDVALAHLGTFWGGEGVLVLSGTGSMAWARGPAGEARVGGWGDLIGDEGSAFSIGSHALMIVARVLDGRLPRDDFVDALLVRLGAQGPFAPLAWLMEHGASLRAEVAGIARHVDALAEEGHEQAKVILDEAADDLAWQARTAARRANLAERFRWVPSGSVFRSQTVTAGVADWLGPPDPPRLTALAGGLLRAAEMAGWAPDAAWAASVDARLRG